MYSKIDGQNRVFLLGAPSEGDTIQIYLNGVRLRRGIDYTIGGDGWEAILAQAPLLGDSLEFEYLKQNIGEGEEDNFEPGETLSGPIDGSNTLFEMTPNRTFRRFTTRLFQNGLRLELGDEYSEIGHTRVQLISAPAVGDDLTIDYIKFLPWAKKVLIATRNKGFFYTEDFSGPGGGHPTWTPVNSGLGEDQQIQQVISDPSDPAGRQFGIILVDGVAWKVYRRVTAVSGNWESILSTNEANALTGCSSGWMFWICDNINRAGYFYVLYSGLNVDHYEMWCLRTPDYGGNWSAFKIADAEFGVGNISNIVAGAFQGTSPYPAGDVLYTVVPDEENNCHIYTSPDNAVTWSQGAALGIYGNGLRIEVDGSDQSIVYAGKGVNGTYHLVRSMNHGATVTEVDGDDELGLMFAWPGYATAYIYIWDNDIMRVLKISDVGGPVAHLWKTTDFWATRTDLGALDKEVGIISAMHDSPDNLYLARCWISAASVEDPHVIFVSDDEGATLEGKSGAHADQEDGGGDSIPYDCGGVAEMGIMVIPPG